MTSAEGHDFAKRHGCLFVETSAKTNVAVSAAFEELLLRVLDSPTLLASTGVSTGVKLTQAQQGAGSSVCYC